VNGAVRATLKCRPARVFCEGEYVWCLEQGKYEGVQLDGLNFGMFCHFPAAIHLGNLTTAVIVDVRANPEQKVALESKLTKIVPFGIFLDLTSNFLGIRYEEFEVHLGGIQSRITSTEVYELCLPNDQPGDRRARLGDLAQAHWVHIKNSGVVRDHSRTSYHKGPYLRA
jgi:hypothetical protein